MNSHLESLQMIQLRFPDNDTSDEIHIIARLHKVYAR